MKFSTNKEKGNTALGIAIAYFSSQGNVVSIPLNDIQDYDLIIEESDGLKKIQVKATGCKTKHAIYQVALKSCGGTGRVKNQITIENVTIVCYKYKKKREKRGKSEKIEEISRYM